MCIQNFGNKYYLQSNVASINGKTIIFVSVNNCQWNDNFPTCKLTTILGKYSIIWLNIKARNTARYMYGLMCNRFVYQLSNMYSFPFYESNLINLFCICLTESMCVPKDPETTEPIWFSITV